MHRSPGARGLRCKLQHFSDAEPTDAQVAQEALAGVSHFGYDVNGSYIVATPHGRNSQGFGTTFCAHHSARVHLDGHSERSVRQEILHDGRPVQQR